MFINALLLSGVGAYSMLNPSHGNCQNLVHFIFKYKNYIYIKYFFYIMLNFRHVRQVMMFSLYTLVAVGLTTVQTKKQH